MAEERGVPQGVISQYGISPRERVTSNSLMHASGRIDFLGETESLSWTPILDFQDSKGHQKAEETNHQVDRTRPGKIATSFSVRAHTIYKDTDTHYDYWKGVIEN
ncbi:uncharacterized protein LOC111674011 [Orussus abietinus]|uniref:uncharacterized protein LOC111674011 n=1 Tax=Orussus abietinus TaxID=222816 RepID=UPI000C715A7F|nr:uncharacterized protein LOC111674011 [Orussus abietinus]